MRDKDNTVSATIVKQDQSPTMFHAANLHSHSCGVENDQLQRGSRNMQVADFLLGRKTIRFPDFYIR